MQGQSLLWCNAYCRLVAGHLRHAASPGQLDCPLDFILLLQGAQQGQHGLQNCASVYLHSATLQAFDHWADSLSCPCRCHPIGLSLRSQRHPGCLAGRCRRQTGWRRYPSARRAAFVVAGRAAAASFATAAPSSCPPLVSNARRPLLVGII